MSMITGYKFFKIYQSLNLHFFSSFDILKYGSKSKSTTEDIFTNRNDASRFEYLGSKVINEKMAFNLCVANFVHNDKEWFYKEFSECKDFYEKWEGYNKSFSYRFKKEFTFLKETMSTKNKTFNCFIKKTEKGNNPPLLQLYLHKKITPEFLCTLDAKFKFINTWYDEFSNDDPYLEKQLQILTKYTPLYKIIRSRLIS